MTEETKAPKPTLSAPPEEELERAVEQNPDDEDAKIDLGSDQSMDASDPPSAARSGTKDTPVPSSGFPKDD